MTYKITTPLAASVIVTITTFILTLRIITRRQTETSTTNCLSHSHAISLYVLTAYSYLFSILCADRILVPFPCIIWSHTHDMSLYVLIVYSCHFLICADSILLPFPYMCWSYALAISLYVQFILFSFQLCKPSLSPTCAAMSHQPAYSGLPYERKQLVIIEVMIWLPPYYTAFIIWPIPMGW